MTRRALFLVAIVVVLLVMGSRRSGAVVGQSSTPQVTVVFEDAAINPENRDAANLIKDSGAFQRVADWTNMVVSLSYPIEIKVTDNLPPPIDDPSTWPDGRTIYYPADFLTMSRGVLTSSVADLNSQGRRPSIIPAEKFNADDLTVWSNEFILGHEMGHALMHQLLLPITGLEEDSADGFAVFSTINGQEGIGPAVAAAILFDEVARQQGALKFEEFASDHPTTVQRIFNFICFVAGSDESRLQNSLITQGYIPAFRSVLCPMEWAQLNNGWWVVLRPYLTAGFSAQAAALRDQARQNLDAEYKRLPDLLQQARGG